MSTYMLGTVTQNDLYLIGKLDKGQYVIVDEDITITKGEQIIVANKGD